MPASAAMADIFSPRLKLASFVFCIFTDPVVTSAFTGPVLAVVTSRSPPFSVALGGSITPTAGSIASRSSTGIFCPFSFRFTDVTFPCAS